MSNSATSRRETQAILFALAAVFLWSTVATAFKLGLQSLTPAQLLFSACVASTAVFALYKTWVRVWPRVTAPSIPRPAPLSAPTIAHACALGVLNPGLYYLLLFGAYDRLPAQIAQPLNYTWAIVLALLAWPMLGQRLGVRTLCGISVSYCGVLILLSQGQWQLATDLNTTGLLLALASTLIWALYWLSVERSPLNGSTLMLVSFSFATPLIGLYCWATDGLPGWNQDTLLYGGYVGCVEMGITFLLWQRALQLTNHAARIGQLIFFSPFISLIIIANVLGEQIHPSVVLGLVVIVLGVLLTRQPGA